MDIRQIERLMSSMQEHGVTSLQLTTGDTQLHLERHAQTAVQSVLPIPLQDTAPLAQCSASTATAPTTTLQPQGGKQVLSPMVGTFHPNPKKPVTLGDKLKKGDVLCVIEAMKLMNEITMEEDGEITFLALKDNDLIEFGQLLAHYK